MTHKLVNATALVYTAEVRTKVHNGSTCKTFPPPCVGRVSPVFLIYNQMLVTPVAQGQLSFGVSISRPGKFPSGTDLSLCKEGTNK